VTATHSATIASFTYTPFDVRIEVGDTVEWRNADPTVHTVTASRGEFTSGSMRQGQLFRATFTVPGVYPYFCEPHEQMRGTVSVVGPPSTSAPVATTTTTALSYAPAPGTITTSFPSVGPTTTLPAVAERPTTQPGVVVASAVTGSADQPSPVAPVAGSLLLVVMALAALVRVGVHREHALRYLAIAATVATGLLHAQLRLALDYPEPIGTLLVIEAAGAAVLAAWLAVAPWTRRKQLVAIGAHVAALGALAITRTGVGLFGFHEIGWDPSPQLPLAIAIGVTAVALLSAARSTR
jgi:hypothetical protein